MRISLLLIVLVACEHGQSPPDGGGDDDGPPITCTKDSLISGELIDWDSTDASFLGIDGASVVVRLDPSTGTITPPNGRLEFCSRPDLPLEFFVDGPGDYVDGTLSISRDVLTFGGTLSLRAFTATRAASFFAERGLTFDPNAAQVVVLSTGDRLSLALDLPHGAPQSGNDNNGTGELDWQTGDAGRYVLFPNVDATGSSTGTITTQPNVTQTVLVAPGQLSLVAMSFVIVGP